MCSKSPSPREISTCAPTRVSPSSLWPAAPGRRPSFPCWNIFLKGNSTRTTRSTFSSAFEASATSSFTTASSPGTRANPGFTTSLPYPIPAAGRQLGGSDRLRPNTPGRAHRGTHGSSCLPGRSPDHDSSLLKRCSDPRELPRTGPTTTKSKPGSSNETPRHPTRQFSSWPLQSTRYRASRLFLRPLGSPWLLRPTTSNPFPSPGTLISSSGRPSPEERAARQRTGLRLLRQILVLWLRAVPDCDGTGCVRSGSLERASPAAHERRPDSDPLPIDSGTDRSHWRRRRATFPTCLFGPGQPSGSFPTSWAASWNPSHAAPKKTQACPSCSFSSYDALLAHDHSMNQTWAIVRNRPRAGKRLQSTLDRIQQADPTGSRPGRPNRSSQGNLERAV